MAPSRFRTALPLTRAPGLLPFFPLNVLARCDGRSRGDAPRSSTSEAGHGSVFRSSRSSIKGASRSLDNRGKIRRDPDAVSEFERAHSESPGCHQCEVDHIVRLAKGRRDDPSNMQWCSREQH